MGTPYRVVMLGVAEGEDEAAVTARLAKLFRCDVDKMASLLGSAPVVLRSEGERSRAEHVQAKAAGCGARVVVREDAPSEEGEGRICPKCLYVRRASDDLVPAYECPKCGVVYAKAERHQAAVAAVVAVAEEGARPADAEVDVAGEAGADPRYEAIEAAFKRFDALLALVLKESGEQGRSEHLGCMCGLAALVVTGGVWALSRWYFALLVFLIGMWITHQALEARRRRGAPMVARRFKADLPAPGCREDRVVHEAALRLWLARGDAALRESFSAALVPGAATAEVQALMEAFTAHEEAQVAAALAAAEAAAAAEREFAKALPEDATRPIRVMRVQYHPSFLAPNIYVPPLALSEQWLLLVGEEATLKIPWSCVKSVSVSPQTEGLSVDAVVANLIDRPLKRELFRVRVDFHLWMVLRSGATNEEFEALSFVYNEDDWDEVGARWRELAQRRFGEKAQCPLCQERTLEGLRLKVGAKMGLRAPQVRARCTLCCKELVLDLTRGVLALAPE